MDCFTLKMATVAKAEPGQSQEPRTSSESPIRVAGAQALEPLFYALQNAHYQKAGSEAEEPDLTPGIENGHPQQRLTCCVRHQVL